MVLLYEEHKVFQVGSRSPSHWLDNRSLDSYDEGISIGHDYGSNDTRGELLADDSRGDLLANLGNITDKSIKRGD